MGTLFFILITQITLCNPAFKADVDNAEFCVEEKDPTAREKVMDDLAPETSAEMKYCAKSRPISNLAYKKKNELRKKLSAEVDKEKKVNEW